MEYMGLGWPLLFPPSPAAAQRPDLAPLTHQATTPAQATLRLLWCCIAALHIIYGEPNQGEGAVALTRALMAMGLPPCQPQRSRWSGAAACFGSGPYLTSKKDGDSQGMDGANHPINHACI